MTTPVTFKTAVKAKEKGFDKPCVDYYDSKRELWDHCNEYNWGMACKAPHKCIAAPTQSELAKWLRELPTPILVVVDGDFISYECCIKHPDKGLFWITENEDEHYTEYEKVLEAGLDLAMDLI